MTDDTLCGCGRKPERSPLSAALECWYCLMREALKGLLR